MKLNLSRVLVVAIGLVIGVVGFLILRKESVEQTGGAGEEVATESRLSAKPNEGPLAIDRNSIVYSDSGGRVRLTGSVPNIIKRSRKIQTPKDSQDRELTLTLVLNRTDQEGFDQYLQALQDPQSTSFRKYLTQRELADRFGPSRAAYKSVKRWLRRNDLQLIEGSDNRLTLSVRATLGRTEEAFGVEINEYQLGETQFYANETEPSVPAQIAPYIQAVIGLSNLTKPGPNKKIWVDNTCKAKATAEGFTYGTAEEMKARAREIFVKCVEDGYKQHGISAATPSDFLDKTPGQSQLRGALLQQALSPKWIDVDGTGQTVGIVAFDTFVRNDIRDFLALADLPATYIDRLSEVHVNGGAQLGPDQTEVLLDILAVLLNAPGANVIVYDAPFTGNSTSYQMIFNKMINDQVDIITNSWSYCEDQTTASDVQSIDSILASAAASGISVFNASGDTGSTCLNGSANTIGVPANSPHATAVGGTTATLGPASTYQSETLWFGQNNTPPTGFGGFGVSRFFTRPAYQDGFNSSPMRSIPDVALNADPTKGALLCQASAGGCPTNLTYGGTSLAAPMWAAFTALLNQAHGQNLGQMNPLLYPLGNTNAFHSATSAGSDFQHLGLGSPNLNLIHRALSGKTAGPVSATVSRVDVEPAVQVANGTSEAFVVVRLLDADGHIVSGKNVTLTANAGSHASISPASGVSNTANGAVIFSIKNSTVETVTFTATDTTDGTVLTKQGTIVFVAPPATSGSIMATPNTVNANGVDTTTITVTLQDLNGNPSPGKLVGLSQGNGGSIISATTAITDATGKVHFQATNNKTETVTYTATDITDFDLEVPGSATVNFVNGLVCNQLGTSASGYAVSTFVSGFPNGGCNTLGPAGLTFDAQGNLFVGGWSNNTLYKFGPEGGAADPAHKLGAIFQAEIADLAFTPDGRLYVALWNGNQILEVNPLSRSIIRSIATLTVNHPSGMAVDPLSGDLFVTQSFDTNVVRLSNFANGPATVTPYAHIDPNVNGGVDGLTFGRDGTLYLARLGFNEIYKIAGTNKPQPAAVTLLARLPMPDGLAVEENPTDPTKPILYVNRNDGVITRIDTSLLPATPANPCSVGCTDIYSASTRGDHVTVGLDGCLYASQSDRVVRVTKSDGTCGLAPVNLAPQILLSPLNVTPTPAQGTPATFTVSVRNVSPLENRSILLTTIGANPGPHVITTDVNGNASFTYTGIRTGEDQVVASMVVGGKTVFSNFASVKWSEGKHSTVLSLNGSQGSGTINQPLVLKAALVDISNTPVNGVSGETINFSVAGQMCNGTTDTTGTASCSVTPTVAAGSYPLTATFGGSNTLLSSSASENVDLSAPVVGPLVQFSATTYNVVEDCTFVTITVNRVGDSSGEVSVDYTTSDVSATERSDYITALGKLTFSAGETQKTFVVLINEDSYVEGLETFRVVLTNPVGINLGTQAISEVQIIDDASEPATNVIDDPQNFVCQQYHDFLNRQPDPDGLAFWTNEITSCGANTTCVEIKRINVSAAFYLSIEFQETGFLVERIYRSAYGTANGSSMIGGAHTLPVPVIRFNELLFDAQKISEGIIVGQPGWEQTIENNKRAFTTQFVERSRFKTAFPMSMTAAEFVDKLNMNAGNPLSTSERNQLINALAGSTMTRAQVLRAVAEDSDLKNLEFNSAFVMMQYAGYLRRDPNATPDSEYSGYDFWLTKLNQFNGNFVDAEMVKAFIVSIEYRRRFGF